MWWFDVVVVLLLEHGLLCLFLCFVCFFFFFFSSRRRHTRWTGDWSSDVCSSDSLAERQVARALDQVLQEQIERALLGFANLDLAAVEPQPRRLADVVVEARCRGRRSEERRVGKECRARWSRGDEKRSRRSRKSRD